jgi:hypothetical protein
VYHPESVRAILNRGTGEGEVLHGSDIELAATDVLDVLFSASTQWTSDLYDFGVAGLGTNGKEAKFGRFGPAFRAAVTELTRWHTLSLEELATARVAGWRLAKEQGLIKFGSGLLSDAVYTSADLRGFSIDIFTSIPDDDSGGDAAHFVTYTLDTLVRLATSVCWFTALDIRNRVKLVGNDDYFAAKGLWSALLERMLRFDRRGRNGDDGVVFVYRLVMLTNGYPTEPMAGVLGTGLGEDGPDMKAMTPDGDGDPFPLTARGSLAAYDRKTRRHIAEVLVTGSDEERLALFDGLASKVAGQVKVAVKAARKSRADTSRLAARMVWDSFPQVVPAPASAPAFAILTEDGWVGNNLGTFGKLLDVLDGSARADVGATGHVPGNGTAE